MSPNSLSVMLKDIGPALGDHLWQSTVCALLAGFLTLILRRNHARVRYWLWLAASIKFLIPFSLMVGMGSHMVWLRGPAAADPGLYVTMQELSQPFAQPALSTAPASPSSTLTHWLPAILAGTWFCGFGAVLLTWCLRWQTVSRDIGRARPLHQGREVDALRRAERVTGLRQRVEMLLSGATLEPGIFGLSRPVLVWPEGISKLLEDPHLEAIVAHELVHVRRRDNLAAALHMAVEAIFWFHPLVWWLGARLMDERERACDEQVLELGSERQVYAESILKVCEFCVGSPLACVSGVTGADLKKRMVHIMSEQVVRKLDFSKKLLLSLIAAAVIAAPIVFGLFNPTPSRAQSQDDRTVSTDNVAQSATIKASELNTPTYAGTKTHMIRMMYGPDEFQAANVTLRALMQEAYQVQANQIVGPPELLDSGAFDVQVKLAKADTMPPSLQDMREARSALQKLLADRVKLVFHTETRDLSTYSLLVADNGSKLQPTLSPETDETKGPGPVRMGTKQMRMQRGGDEVYGIGAQGISTDDLAQQLSRQLGTPVVNKTGLKGRYDFNLHWNDAATGSSRNEASSESASEPSLFTAIQDQLGLKLEPRKAPMDVLVIDHVEQPATN